MRQDDHKGRACNAGRGDRDFVDALRTGCAGLHMRSMSLDATIDKFLGGTFMPPRKPRIGLVLAGGGARGAYQVGVLRAISEISTRRRNPFGVITGVSVGSINAVGVAGSTVSFRHTVAGLEALWSQLRTQNVMRCNAWALGTRALHWAAALTLGGLGVGNPRSLLDNTPLRDLLEAHVNLSGARQAMLRGHLHALAISASGYTTGRAISFFEGHPSLETWRRERREGQRDELSVSHLLASAALPFVFPAQRIDGEYFGDGALRLTAPLSPAIRLGADRILIIGGRDDAPTETDPTASDLPYPSLGALAGAMLDVIFNDNLSADLERVTRINETLDLLPREAMETTKLRPIETLVISPSQDVRLLAGEHADAMPPTLKMFMRGMGAWGEPWLLPSYILFEPGYINALIELGYRDARARWEDIARFIHVGGVSV